MDRADRLARSLELEKAYVHDTYQEMYHPAHKTKPWPKVTRFLHDLEPGSLVCDIGEPTALSDCCLTVSNSPVSYFAL